MAALVDIDGLLEPISSSQPAGEDLRWTAEWDRVKEARRADDGLPSGNWDKKEKKISDWRLVRDLSTAMLQKRSKDLQLALWMTEASVKLEGFAGLRHGLHLTRELMVRFWDNDLFPPMEDGPRDRSGPFEWMNEKLVDSVLHVPITRSVNGDDFNVLQLREARSVGSISGWKDADGYVDTDKKKVFDKALAEGRRSMDMFRQALSETKREAYEALASDCLAAYQEFKALEKVIDEKFIDEKQSDESRRHIGPSLKDFRSAMDEIQKEVLDCLAEKRRQEPDTPLLTATEADGVAGTKADSITIRVPLTGANASAPLTGSHSSWQEAERLIRAGQVDAGLSEMIRLAAGETSGRSRFQRKFLLAEICLVSNRARLARTVLEELAEQIDKFQLEAWEASDVVGGVWTRLYQIYNSGTSSDKDRAAKLYDRLCRLDPWQALACAE